MPSMNNRLETTIDIAECMVAMLKDVAANYPEDQLDVERDSKRIIQQSKSRGQPFFTIDLPDVGGALDRSLSTGRLNLGGLPHSRRCRPGSVIPRLFQGLWKRIFDNDGSLLEDVDVSALNLLRGLLFAFKKVAVEAPKASLFKMTKEFYTDERKLPPTPNWWDSTEEPNRNDLGHLCDLDIDSVWPTGTIPPRRDVDGNRLLSSVQRVADRLSSDLGFFYPKDIRGRHGPGAVSELPASRYKYDFGVWSPNLEESFPYDEFAVANLSLVEESHSHVDISFREEGSRLIPVPKTQKGPRLIAAEPISHQWIQQGVSRVFRERVAATCLGVSIDFFDQTPSQDAALQGSLDAKTATVDLKSASDNLSCYVVQRIFRANYSLLKMLRACRTRFLLNSIDSKEQNLLKLRKFATMGSALTFPLQTFVFAVICLGVGASRHPRRSRLSLLKEVRVFGDDIVVPKTWVPDLIKVLTLMGLKVSTTKTFVEGYFRESCGVDAYRGTVVTPPHVKRLDLDALNPDCASSWLDVANNFYYKGWWHTSAWMTRTVPSLRSAVVVSVQSGSPGLHTFTNRSKHDYEQVYVRNLPTRVGSGTFPRYRTSSYVRLRSGEGQVGVPIRWNVHLQRCELRIRGFSKRSRPQALAQGSPSLLLERFTVEQRGQSVPSIRGERSGREVRLSPIELERAPGRDLRHFDRVWSVLGHLSFKKPLQSDESGAVVRATWVPAQDYLSAGV